MKKHYAVLSILVIAAILLSIGLYQSYTPINQNNPTEYDLDKLDSVVESFGSGRYEANIYNDIKMSVLAAHSNQEITDARKDDILITLDFASQRALVNSINHWFDSACETESIETIIKESKKFENPIAELKSAQKDYGRYKAATSFNNRLDMLIAGEYDLVKNSSLKADFNSLVSRSRFESCPKIVSIKNRIQIELENFEYFYNNIYMPFRSDSAMFHARVDADAEKYQKYLFYTKQQ